MGFCMGVKRAVEKAENSLHDYPEKYVYTLGPLIHNKTVLESLEKKGLKILSADDIDKIDGKNSVVIIRAHGIPPKTMKKLEKTGCIIVNATCPRVLSSQKRTEKFASDGYDVVIAGDKNHGEVLSIQGYANENAKTGVKSFVVENEEQAKNLVLENPKCVVLSQTTFSPAEYTKIVEAVLEKNPNATVLNTICSATEERQNALHELCKKCDLVFVIGGKESANTRRLYELAKSHCAESNCDDSEYKVKKAFHFEDVEEFKNSQIVYNALSVVLNAEDCNQDSKLSVGVTAGASTPESSVNEFVNFLGVTPY